MDDGRGEFMLLFSSSLLSCMMLSVGTVRFCFNKHRNYVLMEYFILV